jgi:S1-C subfamily serine protease
LRNAAGTRFGKQDLALSNPGGSEVPQLRPAAIVALLSIAAAAAAAPPGSIINTSAPLQTDSAASSSLAGLKSVFRVICKETNTFGTAFLHKSGDVITAAHVVEGCTHPAIETDVITTVPATIVRADTEKDLALLKPSKKIDAQALRISSTENFHIGSEISFWGFPAGYSGPSPMLSVGYLAGKDTVLTKSKKWNPQWVINAAINHGNSGGPVVLVETGEVIGVADSKIAPLSETALNALAALQAQKSGFVYTARNFDGTTQTFSEGQVIAIVLEELRQQVQLVIGNAVILGDLRSFLKESGVDP